MWIWPTASLPDSIRTDLMKEPRNKLSEVNFRSSDTGMENRLSSRVKFRWPAVIMTGQRALEGITRNVSANGAFLYYYQPHQHGIPLPLKQRVVLVIKVPDRTPLLMHAEVVWSAVLSSDEENTLLGVGLRFLEIFYEDRQYLRDSILKHLERKQED